MTTNFGSDKDIMGQVVFSERSEELNNLQQYK